MGKIGKYPQRISKIKPFINKYDWNGINYPSRKDDWEKKLEKNNPTIALLTCYRLEKWIYILPTFQNTTQIMKKRSFF